MPHLPITLAITGASGAPYAVRLLERLLIAERPVSLIVSGHGLRLLSTESDVATAGALRERVGAAGWDQYVRVYSDADRGAAPASGSALSAGMVICPCSMGTVASIAAGTSRSLVERAADVALKERRPLILVPRETPLSVIHLENMLRVTRAGATVMPAAPGFYHRPATIADLVDFVVARVLDHLALPHDLVRRWGVGSWRTRQMRDERAHVVGLISDTHGLVRAAVHDALAGVEMILHAGDVGEGVLEELAMIVPTFAVRGNTDPAGDPRLPAELVREVGGVSVHVSHGHETGSPTPEKLLARYPHDVLVYGHTHRPLVVRAGGRLVVNPGAAGTRRFNLRPSVARLTIVGGRAEVALIELE